jgi:hypothetical protein
MKLTDMLKHRQTGSEYFKWIADIKMPSMFEVAAVIDSIKMVQ